VILSFTLAFGFFLSCEFLNAQVQLRDTTIEWQHHEFELNSDFSINTYSETDSDIEKVSFGKAKMIENDLIRLILVPEYGGRVLSFFYKPTGHEYLHQSERGSAYNIETGTTARTPGLTSVEVLDIDLRVRGNRQIQAQFSAASNYNIEVYTIDGKLIASQKFTGSSLVLQLPTSGLYFVSITDNNKLFMLKVFVY